MRRVFRIGLIVVAVFAALGGVDGLLHGPGPDALRREPVNAQASVTDTYIDGFGGDPMVDYRFEVNGKTYEGSGTGGELGNGDVLRLHAGDYVAIQYAATDPSLSCTCDARNASSWRLPPGGGLDPADLMLFLPLVGVIAWELRTRLRTRKS
ncbi:MAG TPA: hypothetical protein VEZ14_08570 [Dehalococcoidia bacterium]|nr:hypothetical protein [Dehalococcoidia bacterium]